MNTNSEDAGCRERGNRYDASDSLAFRKLNALRSSFRGFGMRIAELVVVCLVVGAIAACGSKDSATSAKAPGAANAGSGSSKKDSATSAKTAGASRAGSKSSDVAATASEVAAESRGNTKCPAKITSAPRDPSAPVDDVLGVRPGMTYEEAAAVVLCTNDLMVVQPDSSRSFELQTYGQKIQQGFNARFAEPRIQKTSKQALQEMQDASIARQMHRIVRDMKPGQSKWYVGTMGMPGQERVISVAREEWFEEGRNPTIASIDQALRGKYGTPNKNVGRQVLMWVYDPLGRLVTATSPLIVKCRGNANPNASTDFSPDCGIVISAAIFPMPDNPDLSQYLQVSVVNQAGGYESITATEKGLQQVDAQRRAQEVEKASTSAKAPKL